MAVRQRAMGTLPNLIRSLRKESLLNPKPTNPSVLPSLRRAFSLYDQVNLINDVPEDQLRFKGYSDTGFNVNGVDYEGSLLCVGNFLMSWAPTKFSDITPERFVYNPIFEFFDSINVSPNWIKVFNSIVIWVPVIFFSHGGFLIEFKVVVFVWFCQWTKHHFHERMR